MAPEKNDELWKYSWQQAFYNLLLSHQPLAWPKIRQKQDGFVNLWKSVSWELLVGYSISFRCPYAQKHCSKGSISMLLHRNLLCITSQSDPDNGVKLMILPQKWGFLTENGDRLPTISLLIFSRFHIHTLHFIVIFLNNVGTWFITFRLAGRCVDMWDVIVKDFLENLTQNKL